MDVFQLRDDLIGAYRQYATSFMRLRDERIRRRVAEALDTGSLWPYPQIGLNPAFRPGGTIDDLVAPGTLHPQAASIFRIGKSSDDAVGQPLTLHQHQADAIAAAGSGHNYVLTTGTGSGKSLSYIIPIVDHVLRHGSGRGIKAIVVYPMNALANSQLEELGRFLDHGPWGTARPVTFARYTGQEKGEEREAILRDPPDIVLTNYVMLELILTRYQDRRLVDNLGALRFLVLDELHTYRGRQGSDVAMLVRRLREASGSQRLRCVGTSATLSSEGTFDERQVKVAEVASTMFGAEVRPNEVISETLERVTPAFDNADVEFVAALRERIASQAAPPNTYEDFVADPLSRWIESTFGLRLDDDRLVRATPLAIDGPHGGASHLASLVQLDVDVCERAIREQLLAGYRVHRPGSPFPTFAFRLHQFLSRGDTVYASPEPASERHVRLDRQRFVPGDRQRALLPLAFCRTCGQDYYTVSRQPAEAGQLLVPRDLGDMTGEPGEEPGFLYLSDDLPWPDDENEVVARLPEDWLDDAGRLRSNHRDHLPVPVVVAADGTLATADDASGTRGWWVRTPFRFCLACGVAYAGRLGRDFTRLATLGSDGRSTATTIMSLAAVRALRGIDTLMPEAKKLLSFTDNRQDASLQAGHFNDFIRVTLLRAALWRAVDSAGASGLSHDEVPQRVFKHLNLPFADYARDPDLRGLARNDTDGVLREVLAYHLYRDLTRGWRLNQPNLEQTGLLQIDYEGLDDVAGDDDLWTSRHPALAKASTETRRELLRTLLDSVRRELAIRVDVLDPIFQEGLQRRADQRLAGPWSLDEERLDFASEVLTRGRRRNDGRQWTYVSARGGFGQYLRRTSVLGGRARLTLDDTTEIVTDIFEALRLYGLLEHVGDDDDGNKRWQLPASALRWRVGDGTHPFHDPIRMPNLPAEAATTNQFFVDLYRTVGTELLGTEAREHTAQVRYEDRIEREERFRSADLAVLYCSPTMELGVDIAQLNVVNMRNVPPTPANYAQRSGRAGRSGQPALVFTYCAVGNSHDQHFFRRPELMVAGQVEAPRLDLANEDLLRAHVQAVWLAESGLDLGRSMGDVLNLGEGGDEPPMQPSVQAHVDDADARARARQRAVRVLDALGDAVTSAPWWSATWLDDVLAAIPARFEQALSRWRTLYKAALQQQAEQGRLRVRPGLSVSDRREAERLRREAERQLDLLRAEDDSRGQTDFYTYRYFAAEGFLPGYSFPRLPLSAYIPGRRGRTDEPEYVQRPRFLAISEFGPQSLIYHEGARYRINRVILPVGDTESSDGELVTGQAKRCNRCGYLHPIPDPPGPDVCERCGRQLPAPFVNLFRLQNVSTVRRDRITSDEEERQAKGYELISSVRFAIRSGRLSVEEASVTGPDGPLMRLAYGDTATIWRINLGWRRRKEQHRLGFVLDVERGYWGNSDDVDADDLQDGLSQRTRRVIPYVEDTRNALIVTPAEPLDVTTMASVQAALKAAMQTVFQLEENELAAEPLPSRTERHAWLIYESAEGGAGVLRRLLHEPRLWTRVAAEALRRCHVDPATGDDADGAATACEASCYDCLLSYRNQSDHQHLDRRAAIPFLAQLHRSTGLEAAGVATVVDAVESVLEAEFLDVLSTGGYRLPDRSQVYFEAAAARPDFVYDTACAVVYIDGPHHDYPDRAARDAAADDKLRNLGYRVIRFGHRDDWAQLLDAHRDVFGDGAER